MHYNFHTHISTNNTKEIINLDNSILIKDKTYSYGIHPSKVKCEIFNNYLIQNTNCLAIGECGLDKTIKIDLDIQIECFKSQITLSEKYKLPLIIHCVKATNELIKIKKTLNPSQTWILHGFRKANTLKDLLENNFLIGIGSAAMFDQKLQECIKSIPIESILLETDNQNKYTIEDIYIKVASLKNITLQELEKNIENTFKKTFTKWKNG